MTAYVKHLISNKLFLVLMISLIAGIGIFKSCQEPAKQTAAPLEYESLTLKRPSTLPDTLPTNNDTTIYWTDYVKFQNDSLNRWLMNHVIFDEEAKTLEADADLLFKRHGEVESQREGFPNPWMVEQKLTVDHLSEDYISFVFRSYQYLGGAHGNYFTHFLHWDAKLQQEILAHDFFDNNQYQALQDLGEKAFRQKFNLSETASLEDEYFFENGVFRLPENVRILENGDFQFLYGLYEILPYVNGETELEIYAPEIKPFLSEKGLEIWNSLQKTSK